MEQTSDGGFIVAGLTQSFGKGGKNIPVHYLSVLKKSCFFPALAIWEAIVIVNVRRRAALGKRQNLTDEAEFINIMLPKILKELKTQ